MQYREKNGKKIDYFFHEKWKKKWSECWTMCCVVSERQYQCRESKKWMIKLHVRIQGRWWKTFTQKKNCTQFYAKKRKKIKHFKSSVKIRWCEIQCDNGKTTKGNCGQILIWKQINISEKVSHFVHSDLRSNSRIKTICNVAVRVRIEVAAMGQLIADTFVLIFSTWALSSMFIHCFCFCFCVYFFVAVYIF